MGRGIPLLQPFRSPLLRLQKIIYLIDPETQDMHGEHSAKARYSTYRYESFISY